MSQQIRKYSGKFSIIYVKKLLLKLLTVITMSSFNVIIRLTPYNSGEAHYRDKRSVWLFYYQKKKKHRKVKSRNPKSHLSPCFWTNKQF